MDKTILIKSQLQQYYYYKQQEQDYIIELNDLEHQMQNLKAISYDKVAAAPEDRQHKLIRLLDKKTTLERELHDTQIKYQSIALEIGFTRLTSDEINLLELIYLKRLNYDEIALKLFFTNKAYISRKHSVILDKLAK